jgi:predicted O-methyltransferase YrrM
MMALAGGQVTAIDAHSWIPGSLETMTANMAAYGAADRVAILCETSYSAMPRLAAGEASFGLIFVDGDHQAEAVRHDVGWALRLLASGGVLACHDYSEDCCCRPGVRQALNELFPEGGELTNSLFVVRR